MNDRKDREQWENLRFSLEYWSKLLKKISTIQIFPSDKKNNSIHDWFVRRISVVNIVVYKNVSKSGCALKPYKMNDDLLQQIKSNITNSSRIKKKFVRTTKQSDYWTRTKRYTVFWHRIPRVKVIRQVNSTENGKRLIKRFVFSSVSFSTIIIVGVVIVKQHKSTDRLQR